MQQHQLDRGSFSTAASYSSYGGVSIGGSTAFDSNPVSLRNLIGINIAIESYLYW